jgi:formamidopyrimidine-DNA glycosylase
MPELPEVQTVVNDLAAQGIKARRVADVRVFWKKTVAVPTVKQFIARIKNKTVTAIRRRGKFIIIELSEGEFLCIHLRMTGRLHVNQPGGPIDTHDRVIFFLDNGLQLHYHDTRKFGRMYLVGNEQQVCGGLGPEPLAKEFTPQVLKAICTGRKRMLKPLLLDQHVIAGLGNIYVDESLWLAKLHPRHNAHTLTDAQLRRLHKAIRTSLNKGVKNQGTTLGAGQANFYSVGRRRGKNQEQLNVFRRTGLPCPRCGTVIKRTIVGQRSTHICPRCQPAGVVGVKLYCSDDRCFAVRGN